MSSSGVLRRVALVTTDVSEELSASIIRVTRIGELGTMLITASVCVGHRAASSSSIENSVAFGPKAISTD
jgi:hypothetical protein